MATLLAKAELVLASELTPVECERTLVRAQGLGTLTRRAATRRRSLLQMAAGVWHRLPIDDPILERVRLSFPVEPVRTLDAIHLATALDLRRSVPDLRLLSLDRRIRLNARALGFALEPELDVDS